MRNSSTLLFSCLLSRALGGSSNRNTVSLADFCSQFQGLPFALADVLKIAMVEFEEVGHSTSLQPVLVLLASLRPSPDLPPKLSECISGVRVHVERVTRCSDVLLSRMAASALAALHPTASAAAAWLSYITRAFAAIAQRHMHALHPATAVPSAPSRHVTLGYICTATALLDAHVCSSHAAESWCSILHLSSKLSGLALHALAVASPSESERLCLMLRSLSNFVDFTTTFSSSSSSSYAPSEGAAAAAAAISTFLSTAAHVLTERCCTNQLSTLASHSIAACVHNGRAIPFCLKHATLDDVRRILAGCSGSASLLRSSDVTVRRAVLKHCFDAKRGAASGFPVIELLELLVQHLPNESAPPLQRKCLKRLAEVMRIVSSGCFLQQQQQQQPDDGGSSSEPDRLSAAVAEIMSYVSTLVSKAVKNVAPVSSLSAYGTPMTLSEKTIQAVVCAAAAAAAAITHKPDDETNGAFQQLLDVVTGSMLLSNHPDVAEACAAAVGVSGVMQHDAWAAKFSGCLLGLIQVSRTEGLQHTSCSHFSTLSPMIAMHLLVLLMPYLLAISHPILGRL